MINEIANMLPFATTVNFGDVIRINGTGYAVACSPFGTIIVKDLYDGSRASAGTINDGVPALVAAITRIIESVQ